MRHDLVCELGFLDGAHVPFNAGFLATIRAAFPEQELYFFGAARHIEDLKAQLGQSLAATIFWQGFFLRVQELVTSGAFIGS